MKITLAVCLLLCSSVCVTEARAQEVQRDEAIRINTTLVSVPVIVSDRQGRYIPGLKAEDFSLYQDGVRQTIGFFGAAEEPLNVALLLDSSRSTRDVLGKIKDAARELIKLLQPADRAMVVSFDYRVNVLSPLTGDRKRLEKAVKQVEIGETVGTLMRDAVLETVERHFGKVNGRKAIIMLTDGKDFGSSPSKAALLEKLEESDVMVYSVFYQTQMGSMARRGPTGQRGGMGGGRIGGIPIPGIPGGGGNRGGTPGNGGGRTGGGGMPDRERRADAEAILFLNQMAEITAGRFYQKEVTDLKATFAMITDELRKQYRLGYYPPDTGDNTAAHRIRVKVALDDVAVRSRTIYRTK